MPAGTFLPPGIRQPPGRASDDELFTLGTDEDVVLVLDSSGESANAAIDNVIVAASAAVHQGFAANSAVLSNVTTDSDIMMLVSDGGNSKEFLLANGDTADLQLGHGMATATLKTASGALTITSGAAVDIDGAGAVQVNSSGAAISIANDNINQTVNIATGGTRTLNIGIDDGSDATTISIKGDVTMGGVTPRLTIGDAGTEDASVVFDGNAQDYYIGLEDAADSLVIGKGSVLGTTAMMSIGSTPTLGINRTATSSALVAIGGTLTGPDGYDAAALAVTTTVTPDAGDYGYIVRLNGTIAEAGSGTHPNVAQLYLGGTAVTNAGATTTTASTLYINAAMSGADSNNYSIFVDAGSVRLDGSLWVEGTPTEGSSGEQLTSGGAGAVMTWAAASSLGKFKDTIADLVPQDALTKLMSWRPRSFRYKPDAETSTHDYETIYVGVYGEDAPEVMHHEGRIFSPVSAFGYTVGAIQELHNKIQKLEIQLAAR